MTRSILVLFTAVIASAEVRLHGRVYNTEKPAEGIPGIRVTLKEPGGEHKTFTGKNGVYEIRGLTTGSGIAIFSDETKTWQPEAVSRPVDLKPETVELTVDLFKSTPSGANIRVVAQNKAWLINAALQRGESPNAEFEMEWRTCEAAAIPIKDRALCAKILNSSVTGTAFRPPSVLQWAALDPDKASILDKYNFSALQSGGTEHLMDLRKSGIPDSITFAHIEYELDKGNATEAQRKLIEERATKVLGLQESPQRHMIQMNPSRRMVVIDDSTSGKTGVTTMGTRPTERREAGTSSTAAPAAARPQ